MDIRGTSAQNKRQLLSKANVVGVGIGYKIVEGKRTDEPAIICSVKEKLSGSAISSQDLVPKSVDGIPTDVVETGEFVALSRTDRHRPAPGGVSIGHVNITAGTLGCLVKHDGMAHILSNWHVLCAGGETGDKIIQPGAYDGGSNPDDVIAELAKFAPIKFDGESPVPEPPNCPVARFFASILNSLASIVGSSVRLQPMRRITDDQQEEGNLVDAALALPLDPEFVSPEILELGTIQGFAEGQLGMRVKKSGRTTGLTVDEITQIDATVIVRYGEKTATFTDQLIAGPMSQGGDSGSVVLDDDNNVVGLLFAGSSNTTVFNRIQNVVDALEIEEIYA